MGRSPGYINAFLIGPILVLSGFSLALIYSTSPELFWQQLSFFIIGYVFFTLFAFVDYRVFQSLWPITYVVSIVFLLASFWGPDVRGATRWLEFGVIRIQPSEIVKPFLLLSQAAFLATHKRLKLQNAIFFLGLSLLPTLIIFKQPDLGNAIIYFGTSFVLLVTSSISSILILSFLAIGLAIVPIGWHLLHGYQKLRIISFFNPHLDQAGVGYNALQAMIAIGSGGLWGRGLGRGPQSHLRFLPENHTDFIFASLTEELGFFGGSIVIATYFFLLSQLFLIYRKSLTGLGQYFVLGFFTQLFLQIVINIGMNIGLLPITGITLPLISYGGSSIVSTLIAFGIIQRISLESGQSEHAIAIG